MAGGSLANSPGGCPGVILDDSSGGSQIGRPGESQGGSLLGSLGVAWVITHRVTWVVAPEVALEVAWRVPQGRSPGCGPPRM